MFNLKDFEYEIKNNEIVLLKYLGNEIEIVIPNKIDEHVIGQIGEYCFYENNTINKITISKNVNYIGDYAFSRTSRLKEVIIDENSKLKTINKGTFRSSSLVKINIPKSVTKIDDYAFYMSIFLSVVDFDKDSLLKHIGKYAFSHNLLLFEFVVPKNVEIIDDYAFYKSTSLGKVVLSLNLKEIGKKAFKDIIYLEEIVIDDGCTLHTIGEQAISGDNQIKEFKITKHVKTIKKGALASRYLDKLILNQNNKNFIIKDGCLYDKDLKNLIMIIPNKEIHTLHILDDVYVNDLAFLNCYGVQKIIIGNNVKNINYITFSFESSIVEEVKVLDDNFKLIDKCLYNKDMTELLLFY